LLNLINIHTKSEAMNFINQFNKWEETYGTNTAESKNRAKVFGDLLKN